MSSTRCKITECDSSDPVEVLREKGHHSLLATAAESAYRGKPKNHEVPAFAKASAGDLIVDPRLVKTVKTDGYEVRIADFSFCLPDSIFNLLFVNHRDLALTPFSGERDCGVFLRVKLSDKYGKMNSSFDEMMNTISKSNEFPFDLARCTNKRLPGIDDGNLGHKMEYLLALSSKERMRMFLLQCVAKHDGRGKLVGSEKGC